MRSSKVLPLSCRVLKRTICSPWFLLSFPCTLEPTQVMFIPISSPKLFFLKVSNCFPFNKSKHNFNFVLHALSAIFDLMENLFFSFFGFQDWIFREETCLLGFLLAFLVCPSQSVLFLLISHLFHIQVFCSSSFPTFYTFKCPGIHLFIMTLITCIV